MRFDPSKLKQAREAAVLSREEVAVACGVTVGTVRNWESGLHEPDAGDLGNIAALCGRAVSFFYEKDGASR